MKYSKIKHISPKLNLVFDFILVLFVLFISVYPSKGSSFELIVIVGIAFIKISLLFLFKTHKPKQELSNIRDIKNIALALFASLLIVSFILFVFKIDVQITFPQLIFDFTSSFFLLTSKRIIISSFSTESNKRMGSMNTVIYGSSKVAIQTLEAIENSADSDIKVIGFIDDNISVHGKMINNKRIVSPSYIKTNYLKDNIQIVLLTEESGTLKNEIIDFCVVHNIKILEVPPANTWMNKSFSSTELKPLDIGQLLGRSEIKLNNESIKHFIFGKIVMVSGAAGSIGSEICAQILSYHPKQLLLLDQAESGLYDLNYALNPNRTYDCLQTILCNVADTSAVNEVISKYKPHLIYHAAAYKHVPLVEQNPIAALRTNLIGTINLAHAAVKNNVEKFVFISTDKAVNPTNVMGATKRASEMYIQALSNKLSTQFITTRFGNVLGSNGSVVPLFEKQIKRGGPVTVTDERITRYFMTISEACELVIEASLMGNGGEIFVFDMGKSIKIIDLAKKMIFLSGLELNKDIKIKITGLRPGEKLYEELLNDSEITQKTHHDKILIGKTTFSDFETITTQIKELERVLKDRNAFESIKLLKRIVPEFKSENSIYSQLD